MISLLKVWSSQNSNNCPVLLVHTQLHKPKIKALLENIYGLNKISVTIKIKNNLKYAYIQIKDQ